MKQCFIPTCSNNSKNCPNKTFVRVREDLRQNWCRAANAEYHKIGLDFCCEDHIDLRQDLKNYYQHKLMNDEPILKSTAVLRNIGIIPEIRTGHSTTEDPMPSVSTLQPNRTAPTQKRKYVEAFHSGSESLLQHKVMVNAAVQSKVKMVDKETNYRARKYFVKPSTQISRQDSDISLSQESSNTNPSMFGSTSVIGSESEQSRVYPSNESSVNILNLVLNKSKMYLGVPQNVLWILEFIEKNSKNKITFSDLVVTLYKIKQNDSLEKISDLFGISRTNLSKIIYNGIEALASFFQNFIIQPSVSKLKLNLPLVFKIRYSNVQMIIDCFEIEIVKPSNPLRQAQTWSQYKNCNTVKYLIGCTPNGLVSFISEGYGGRISDKALVEQSRFIDSLPHNAVILADRGFKEIESALSSKGIKLLRPPSVYSGVKPTKSEVLESKVIASLRIHVERVIRRIREFAILKPHSVVTYRYVSLLDEIVMIACGLINLQGEIIKKC